MSIIYATGWEHGTKVPTGFTFNADSLDTDPGDVHTGTYSSYDRRGGMNFVLDTPINELYMSLWFKTTSVGDDHRIGFRLEDGSTIYWYDYSPGDGVSRLDYGPGTMSVPFQPISGDWHLMEFHVLVDDTTGVVQLKMDGVMVADYSGDTQPGTAPNNIAEVFTYNYNHHWWDDFVLDDADWPGDVRIEGVMPNSDSAVAWTPSTGTDNYALVDEVPPDDADYVESNTNGQQDLYGKAAWDGTEKTPKGIVVWSRALVTAPGPSIKQLVNSGATLHSSASKALTTSAAHYVEILENDPDTSSPWTEAGINNATVGVELVV